MMSLEKALVIAAVILTVVICCFGWTYQGILFACGYCTAVCVPILIVVALFSPCWKCSASEGRCDRPLAAKAARGVVLL